MTSAIRPVEKLAERLLKVERGANVLPLGHILCYVALLGYCLSPFRAPGVLATAAAMLLITLLNYSLTVGIMHMHAHRSLFTVAGLNRLVDVACCFPSWLTATEMRLVHVEHHHRFDDGAGDVTSTEGFERGGHALWYWARYAYRVKWYTCRRLLRTGLTARLRQRRRQMVTDLFAVVVLSSGLTFVNWRSMVLFYWLPLALTSLTAGYFAWLTHAPARGRDGISSSINNVNNALNFFIFNQGYHSIHHRYPGIHWTEIPDKLAELEEADDAVIVSYWVTLHTAWRLVSPDRFRQPEHGAMWKERLRRRVATGAHRRRLLPYFARI